ncbi:MAG: hypothetical protein ACTS4V_00195 [Candidatus Hodgkinia cicadicola]
MAASKIISSEVITSAVVNGSLRPKAGIVNQTLKVTFVRTNLSTKWIV